MPEKIQGQAPAERMECWGATSQEWASSYPDFEPWSQRRGTSLRRGRRSGGGGGGWERMSNRHFWGTVIRLEFLQHAYQFVCHPFFFFILIIN